MNRTYFSNTRGAVSPRLIGAAVVLGLLVFLAFNSLFIVREWEQVVVTQFGEIQGEPIEAAGLHVKVPFIQEVHRFERRLLRWDGDPFTLYTSDRRTIRVNVTARWRIEDAAAFLPRVRTVERANQLLSQLIEGSLRDRIGQFELYEVVRSSNGILGGAPGTALALDSAVEAEIDMDLEEIVTLGREIKELRQDPQGRYLAGRPIVTAKILELARARTAEVGLGIHLEDILIKQLNYTDDIESNVYAQMNAELGKISAGFRSHGRKNAEAKLGEMEKELARIESAALEQASEIRGRAEAEAMRIYAAAFNRNPDFYRFLRTLETYEETLGANSSVILSTESELFDLLKRPSEARAESSDPAMY